MFLFQQISGAWQGEQSCDDESAICGIRTKFRFGKSKQLELEDFAGINDISLECCPQLGRG